MNPETGKYEAQNSAAPVVTDLAAWLLAQVDTDERVQTAGWVDHVNGEWHRADCETNSAVYGAMSCDCGVPARVLAECAAKRAIIELAEWASADCDQIRGEWGVSSDPDYNDPDTGDLLLRALAAPYRDRPGWRDEWATP